MANCECARAVKGFVWQVASAQHYFTKYLGKKPQQPSKMGKQRIRTALRDLVDNVRGIRLNCPFSPEAQSKIQYSYYTVGRRYSDEDWGELPWAVNQLSKALDEALDTC